MKNGVDPDQLASEANWSGSTLFAKMGQYPVSAGPGIKVPHHHDVHVRREQLNKNFILQARDIYEEAIQTVITVRDFTQVFDAYAQFEKNLISAKMESMEEAGPSEEGKLNEYNEIRVVSLPLSPQLNHKVLG